MYIWTREGLGQGQPIWSTLQTFNRPRGQPTPNGYLGNFNEHMGKTESEPCKQIWAVPGSGSKEENSSLLTPLFDPLAQSLLTAVFLDFRSPISDK
jgi:hypothetical protein